MLAWRDIPLRWRAALVAPTPLAAVGYVLGTKDGILPWIGFVLFATFVVLEIAVSRRLRRAVGSGPSE